MGELWPTFWTGPLLVLGTVPVLYVIYHGSFSGQWEGVSLRLWAVTINWAAYHASPFLAYFFGITWTSISFEMAAQYIDCGLLFSTLCSFATLAGYGLTSSRFASRSAARTMSIDDVKVHSRVLVALVLAYLAFFVISVGGINQVWVSDQQRGTYQWMEVDLRWRITHVFRILCTLTGPVIAVLATIYALQGHSKNRQIRWVLASAAICIATLDGAHEFSRISGLPFVIVGALIVNVRGLAAWKLSFAAISLGLYMGMVGLTQRHNYDMGLGSYASAFLSAWRVEDGNQSTLLDLGSLNPVRAMERFTIKVEIKSIDQPQMFPTACRFLWNLHPFPSMLVPLADVGQDPTDYLALTEISAVPSPAYADLFYVFGYAGCGFALLMGGIYGWFDRLRARQPGLVSSICYFLCVAAIGASTHAGCRPWTRFTFYAFILYLGATLFADAARRRLRLRRSVVATREIRMARP